MSVKILKIQLYGNSGLFGNLVKILHIYNLVVDVVAADDLTGRQFALVCAVCQDEGIYANQIVAQFGIIGQRICEFKDFGRFCNLIDIIIVYGPMKKICNHFGSRINLPFENRASLRGVRVKGDKKINGLIVV